MDNGSENFGRDAVQPRTGGKGRMWLALWTSLLSLLMLEYVLRWILPARVVGVGTEEAPNARLYGWGLMPNEAIQFVNPDTGKVFRGDRTNSRGWKDVEHTVVKPAGKYRILFIGDSHTYGCVPLAELYTRVVEKQLHDIGYTNVEVLSIGVGCWGTDQELEVLKREGVAYEPDLVVYQFCGNDVTDNTQPTPETASDSIFQMKPFRYEVVDDQLVRVERCVKQRNLPRLVRLKRLLLKSALVWNLNQTWKRMVGGWAFPSRREEDKERSVRDEVGTSLPHEAAKTNHWWAQFKPDPLSATFPYCAGEEPEVLKGAWRLLELLIAEMDAVCRSRGASFVVFSVDGEAGGRDWALRWGHILTDDRGDYVMAGTTRVPVRWTKSLENLSYACRRRNIPFISPTSEYRRFEYDPHPNAEGNLAMARDIVRFLTSENGYVLVGTNRVGPE